MPTTQTHFNCPHCGKSYRWDERSAGKQARCACGQTITIPAHIGSRPVTPDAANEQNGEDGLYDIAEPAAPKSVATSAARPTRSAMPPATRDSAGTPRRTDGNRSTAAERPASFDDIYDKQRDFYRPASALATGFVILLSWAATAGADGGGLVLFSAFITAATLVKTAVMIAAAFVIAPLAGVSFGTFWPAVLKLAAIVVMADAGLFWLQELMQATGAYPTGGGGRRVWAAVGLVNTLLAGAIIAVLLKAFFEMDAEDVRNLAIPLAILNRLLNFLIFMIVGALLSAAAEPPAQTPADTPTSPKRTAAAPAKARPPAPTPANAAVAAKDAEIAERVKRKGLVRNASEHYERSANRRGRIEIVRSLHRAGARNVYVELGLDTGRIEPTQLIVELPRGAPERAEIIRQLREFATAQRAPVDPETIRDQGDRYLVIPLPPPQ